MIAAGTPAHACRQIELGDTIIAVDGEPMENEQDLVRALVGCDQPESVAVLTVLRGSGVDTERFVVLTRVSHTAAERGARLYRLLADLVEAAALGEMRTSDVAAEVVSLLSAANITGYDRELERRRLVQIQTPACKQHAALSNADNVPLNQVQSVCEATKMAIEHAEIAVKSIISPGEGENLKYARNAHHQEAVWYSI